jgi:nucleoid DNA-binding protein
MAYEMCFAGTLVFAREDKLEAGLEAFRGKDEDRLFDATAFRRAELSLELSYSCSAPATMWEATLPAVQSLARCAKSGWIDVAFENDDVERFHAGGKRKRLVGDVETYERMLYPKRIQAREAMSNVKPAPTPDAPQDREWLELLAECVLAVGDGVWVRIASVVDVTISRYADGKRFARVILLFWPRDAKGTIDFADWLDRRSKPSAARAEQLSAIAERIKSVMTTTDEVAIPWLGIVRAETITLEPVRNPQTGEMIAREPRRIAKLSLSPELLAKLGVPEAD